MSLKSREPYMSWSKREMLESCDVADFKMQEWSVSQGMCVTSEK